MSEETKLSKARKKFESSRFRQLVAELGELEKKLGRFDQLSESLKIPIILDREFAERLAGGSDCYGRYSQKLHEIIDYVYTHNPVINVNLGFSEQDVESYHDCRKIWNKDDKVWEEKLGDERLVEVPVYELEVTSPSFGMTEEEAHGILDLLNIYNSIANRRVGRLAGSKITSGTNKKSNEIEIGSKESGKVSLEVRDGIVVVSPDMIGRHHSKGLLTNYYIYYDSEHRLTDKFKQPICSRKTFENTVYNLNWIQRRTGANMVFNPLQD